MLTSMNLVSIDDESEGQSGKNQSQYKTGKPNASQKIGMIINTTNSSISRNIIALCNQNQELLNYPIIGHLCIIIFLGLK